METRIVQGDVLTRVGVISMQPTGRTLNFLICKGKALQTEKYPR